MDSTVWVSNLLLFLRSLIAKVYLLRMKLEVNEYMLSTQFLNERIGKL